MILLLLIAPRLALKHLMLSNSGSNRGKSLKGKPKSSYTRWGLPFSSVEFHAKSRYRTLIWPIAVHNQYFVLFHLKVLEQKDVGIAPGALYGSSHTYVTLIETQLSVQCFLVVSCMNSTIWRTHFCIFAALTGMLWGHRIKMGSKGWASMSLAPCIRVLLFHAYNSAVHWAFLCGFLLQVDLLKNQKSDKVDVTIHPEELEVMDDVLAAK